MVTNDLFLIDGTFLLKATETSFLGAPLLLGLDGQDHTRTFGFIRDVFRLRKQHGIRHGAIVIGQESIRATTEEVLSDIISLLNELETPVIRQDNALIGEICAQLAPSARWIITADRTILQLVSDDLSVILVNDREEPEVITKGKLTGSGVQPEQIPALTALSEGKDAPLKKQQAIRLLELYKSLEAALADCSAAPLANWKRRLAPKKEYLLGREAQCRFRRNVEIVRPPVVGGAFISDTRESADALRNRSFWSLLRLLPQPDVPTIHIQQAAEQANEYRAIRNSADLDHLEECLSAAELCAIDTETSGKDPRSATLFGLSLAVKKGQAFFVPMLESDLDGLSPNVVRTRLNRLLTKNLQFVGHNIKYDFAILRRHGIDVGLLHFDTMLAAYECFGDWDSWSLAAVAKKLLGTNIKRYREIVGADETFLDRPFSEMIEHACCDADMTLRLHGALSRELRTRQIDQQFLSHTIQVENLLLERERAGVSVDIRRMASIADLLKKTADSCKTAAMTCAGGDFEIDSPRAATDLLRKLGIWEKTTQSIGEAQMEQLACGHALPSWIVKYRRVQKRRKNVEALCAAAKGDRVFPIFSQIKAAHGCLWSSAPNLDEAVAAQALDDQRLCDLFESAERAIQILQDSSEDTVLQSDLIRRRREDDFIAGEVGISGVEHSEILLAVAIGLPDAAICRRFLLGREDVAPIRTAVTLRYQRLFEWLGQFTTLALAQGYAEYKGRRKFLAGLRSSDLDKRSKAVRSAVRWLIRY